MQKMLNKMKSASGGKKGFTLIELLVVIAIIAILATVVIINVTGARAKAAKASVESNLSVSASIAAACNSFAGASKINTSTAAMAGGSAICSAVLDDVADATELASTTGNWPVLSTGFAYLAGSATNYALVDGPATGSADTIAVTANGIVKSLTW
jgi:type IV pilus assembly protein PilA